jgi:4-carboxymuconolactone decarboxylase
MRRWVGLASSAVVIGAVLWLAIPKVESRTPDKGLRFPYLKMEQLDEAQRQLAAEVMKNSSDARFLTGPFNLWLRSPVLGERMYKVIEYLRYSTSVPQRLNEFAILIQARLWTSQREWYAHYPLAIKAGLSESVAADLRGGKRPASMQPDEAAVYDFCTELSTRHEVSDATFNRARAILSEQQLVDLIALSGTYVTAGMILKAAGDEGLPPGVTPPLPPLRGR